MVDGLVRCVAALVCLLITGAIAQQAVAADAGSAAKGDEWETTSQMTMPGMPMAMPPSKNKHCSPKVWREPPGGGGQDRGCTNSQMQTVGNKFTWTVQCPQMTGVGEITRDGADAFAG